MTTDEGRQLGPALAQQMVRQRAAELVSRPCSAECGAYTMWRPGQEWLRCGNCGTLNWWEGGAS